MWMLPLNRIGIYSDLVGELLVDAAVSITLMVDASVVNALMAEGDGVASE